MRKESMFRYLNECVGIERMKNSLLHYLNLAAAYVAIWLPLQLNLATITVANSAVMTKLAALLGVQ
jgi:hypothetical protein